MKYNILINQKAAKEFNDSLFAKYEADKTPQKERQYLEFTHMVILDLAVNLHIFKGCIKINSDGVDYYLLSYTFIIEQLPLLSCSKQTVYRYLKDVCDMGLMQPHPDNQKMGGAYYRLTKNIEVFHFSSPSIKNDIPPLSKMIDYNISKEEEERATHVLDLEAKKEEARQLAEAYLKRADKYIKLSSKIERFKGLTAPSNIDITFETLIEGYWNQKGHKEYHKSPEWHYKGFEWYLQHEIDDAFKREEEYKTQKQEVKPKTYMTQAEKEKANFEAYQKAYYEKHKVPQHTIELNERNDKLRSESYRR